MDGTIDDLWARAGEQVSCVHGHPICKVARDIRIGDARAPGDFIDWCQQEPACTTSVALIRCAECKGVWVRGNLQDGYQFHFENGWR